MSHVVRKHLRLESDAYDAAIRTFIPGYEEALTRAASEIAGVHPTLVLDLGTGTGALAEALLAHDRAGAVEALDIDPEMLAQARLRLTRFGPRGGSAAGRSRRRSLRVTPWPRPWPCTTCLPWPANAGSMHAFTGRSVPAASSSTPTWPSVRIRWRARRRTVDGSPIWGRAALMNSGLCTLRRMGDGGHLLSSRRRTRGDARRHIPGGMSLAGSPTHAPGRTQDLRPGLRALPCLTVWRCGFSLRVRRRQRLTTACGHRRTPCPGTQGWLVRSSRGCGDCVICVDRSGRAGRDSTTLSNPAAPTPTNTTGDLAVTQPPHGGVGAQIETDRQNPSDGVSPTNGARVRPAHVGHRIEYVAREQCLSRSPARCLGSQAIADNRLVSEKRVLNAGLLLVA